MKKMKIKEAIKRAIKMNELLKQFGQPEKGIDLIVGRNVYKVTTMKEFIKKMKEVFVKEFAEQLMEIELDEKFKASGSISFKTFDGAPSGDWNADYEVEIYIY
jgi:hypothetical protein